MNKYLKATAWAAGIYLIVPVALLYLGYVEMHSSEWDTNDSGAVQGFAFMFLATLSALACVVEISGNKWGQNKLSDRFIY